VREWVDKHTEYRYMQGHVCIRL